MFVIKKGGCCFFKGFCFFFGHERVTKKYNQTRSERLDLCPKNGPSHPKILSKMYCDTRQNHLGTTFSITLRKNIFYHTNWHFQPPPKWSNSHLKTQLTHNQALQTQNTVGTADIQFKRKTSIAERPYIEIPEEGETCPVATKWTNTVEKLYRQLKTNRKSKTPPELKDNVYHKIPHLQQMRTDIDASKNQLYLNWSSQLDGTEHRTKAQDSKTDLFLKRVLLFFTSVL